jgi:hypothetical protein
MSDFMSRSARSADRAARTCRACGRQIAKRHRNAGLCQRCQNERAAVVDAKLAQLATDAQHTPKTPETAAQRRQS